MPSQIKYVLPFVVTFAVLPLIAFSAEPTPPDSFRAIFNGKDLTGWHGLNPHPPSRLKGEKKEANLAQQRAEFSNHWTIENGELVNDGHGPYATTDEEFGDIEFLIEYRTVAGADSGIYMRGTPQVQIWDWHQPFDPKRPTRKPHLGPAACSTTRQESLAAIRWSEPIARLANGTSSAFARLAASPGSG